MATRAPDTELYDRFIEGTAFLDFVDHCMPRYLVLGTAYYRCLDWGLFIDPTAMTIMIREAHYGLNPRRTEAELAKSLVGQWRTAPMKIVTMLRAPRTGGEDPEAAHGA